MLNYNSMLEYKVQEKEQKEQQLTDIGNTEIGDENVITMLNYNGVYSEEDKFKFEEPPNKFEMVLHKGVIGKGDKEEMNSELEEKKKPDFSIEMEFLAEG